MIVKYSTKSFFLFKISCGSISCNVLSSDRNEFIVTAFISSNYNKIADVITEVAVKLIKSNLKYALNAVNIEKIVKDKINALPLPEVENITVFHYDYQGISNNI